MAVVALVVFLGAIVGSGFAQDAAAQFKTTEDLAAAGLYSKVMEPTLKPIHLEDLPGFTRSVVQKDHALVTPESQVYAPLPGWTNTMGAHVITPAMKAHFIFILVRMAGNASARHHYEGVQRFYFVISGTATLEVGGEKQILKADSYAYAPYGQEYSFTTAPGESADLVVIEKYYQPNVPDEEPGFHWGSTGEQPVVPVPGEDFVLRKLLPTSRDWDFNIHVMDFQPGEYLSIKEVHYNQHGLLLLEGKGIYRLANEWYPVQAGDVIYMAPFVPQWYAALGKTRSRYLLYKDTNRDPLWTQCMG